MTEIVVWSLLSLAAVLGFAALALWVIESLEPETSAWDEEYKE